MTVVRKIVLLLVVAVWSVGLSHAGSYTGTGQYVGEPAPIVTRLFAQFSSGGPGLTEPLTAMLISNPALADDVAFVAASGNAAQQAAAAAGMTAAATALAAAGNASGASGITRAAQASGNPVLASAANAARGSGNVASALPASIPASPITRTCRTVADNTVSPSAPTTICE